MLKNHFSSVTEASPYTKSLIAGMLGVMMEWYDYGLFGYLAPILAELFFPSKHKWVSLLQAFMVFAMGFMLRPLGGFIFGSLADRCGRVVALRATILLISLPSLMIACLPTFAMIGWMATVLLIVLRLLQGLSVGGEFAGSMVYLTEISPPRFRILFSGLANNASNIGVLMGVGICTLLSVNLSHEMFLKIGWRVPFILGGFLGLLGYYLRKNFIESDVFLQIQKDKHLHAKPVSVLFKKYLHRLIIGILLSCMGACSIYTLTTYISTYLQVVKHYSLSVALSLQSLLLILTLLLVPIASLLANQFGQIRMLQIATLGMMSYALFAFLHLPENNIVMVGIILLPLIVFVSIEQGVMPSTLTEFFPVAIRYSAVSIAYNVSYAYVGGTAPMYITWLINRTHAAEMPGICIMAASAMTALGLIIMRFDRRLVQHRLNPRLA
ncbi:MAG: MFS transporter [Gammaproteobacteria bacterium]|nr:MFS transporter [Gammaproteobacteria bacterium]